MTALSYQQMENAMPITVDGLRGTVPRLSSADKQRVVEQFTEFEQLVTANAKEMFAELDEHLATNGDQSVRIKRSYVINYGDSLPTGCWNHVFYEIVEHTTQGSDKYQGVRPWDMYCGVGGESSVEITHILRLDVP